MKPVGSGNGAAGAGVLEAGGVPEAARVPLREAGMDDRLLDALR